MITQKEIKQLLQKEDPTVLEFGAHKGGDTGKFLHVFPGIKIYCFEPDPRCIEGFKKCIKDERCVLIEAAVSNIDGKTLLNMSTGSRPSRAHNLIRALGLSKCYAAIKGSDWDMSSSIKNAVSYPIDYPWLSFGNTVEVKTIRPDTWVKQNDIHSVDFIWSDIQGAERDMIEGARNTLAITKYLYMEYGETSSYPEAMTRAATIALMGKHHFAIVPEYSDKEHIGNLLFANRSL